MAINSKSGFTLQCNKCKSKDVQLAVDYNLSAAYVWIQCNSKRCEQTMEIETDYLVTQDGQIDK